MAHTPDSAPTEFAFCPMCASPMVTRQVGDKPRRACSVCAYVYYTDPKVGVGVMVVRESKILLVRRRMKPAQGKWSIPAGFLDRGEDPQQTAVREALEETNLRVKITELVDVYFNSPGNGGASIFILYRAQILGGEPRAGDDVDMVGFFGRDELPELAFASTRDAIQKM